MYKDRYNDSLVRFFSVYYEKISENEVKSIINYTLGLKNDRFSRFIENGKRVDNILDLLEIKYLKINNIIYILESENKLGIHKDDIILNGESILQKSEKNFKILRNEKILQVQIPDICLSKKETFFFSKESEQITYVKIQYFSESTIKKIKMLNLNNRTLILDLIDNMGGNVLLANKFLENFVCSEEPIYYVENIEKKKYGVYINSHLDNNTKIIIMVNSYTASSAELISLVLKNEKRAFIIGEITKGKGVMQKKIKISHNLEILLPVYEYYTSKTKINNVGIIPDIVVNDKLMDDWVKKI